MKTEENFSKKGIRQFNPNNNKTQLLPDGKFHFPLAIPGVGKVDCILNTDMNKLVIPETLFNQRKVEHCPLLCLRKNRKDANSNPLFSFLKVRAFGQLIREAVVIISPEANHIESGIEILRKTKRYKDVYARRSLIRKINSNKNFIK